MEYECLTIEAAGVPGHPSPGRVKRGLRRARLRPDVVARDGRRAVLGIALSGSQIGKIYVPDQLDTIARRCRKLVICVAEEAADETIDTLFGKPMTHWRKMRMLTYPETKWEEVARAAKRKRLGDLARMRGETVSVRVLPDPVWNAPTSSS
jgi:hypothetical protein